MLDDLAERGKPTIVIKATFGMREEPFEWRCAIAIVGPMPLNIEPSIA
jgi:hypothetical protein